MSKHEYTGIYQWRTAFREAAWIFGLSRLIILLISYFGIVMFPVAGQNSPLKCSASFNPCLQAWYHWDAVPYVNITHHAYTYIPDTAFFPLSPSIAPVLAFLLVLLFP